VSSVRYIVLSRWLSGHSGLVQRFDTPTLHLQITRSIAGAVVLDSSLVFAVVVGDWDALSWQMEGWKN